MRIRIVLNLLPLILMIVMQSCEQNNYIMDSQDCANYDYSDCNTTEPLLVPLNIKLTINSENPEVPIIVYKGKFEDNIIESFDTATTSTYNVMLPPGNYYTVTARYVSGDKIIYAIGGDKVEKISNQVCDSICWTEKEGNINVELK